MDSGAEAWVPQSCALPTVAQPIRVAEFDTLFTTALRSQQRLSPSVLRWELDPAAEQAARALAARESACCTFFDFTFSQAADGVFWVQVQVPPGQVGVLDALAARAAEVTAR